MPDEDDQDDRTKLQKLKEELKKLKENLGKQVEANQKMWSTQEKLTFKNQTLVKENERLKLLNQERTTETRDYNVLKEEIKNVKAANEKLMQEMSSQTEHVNKLYLRAPQTSNEYIVRF